MKTKTKTRTKKATAKTSPRSSSKKAYPPPDNPLLRHEELDSDRVIEGQAEEIPAPSLMAAMAPGKRPARAARGRTAVSTVRQTAQLRLEALRQSETMPAIEADIVVAPRRAHAAAAPGAAEMVAPVTGTSNWVQLGPTAIPNGQTYGGTRVLVTGRVTSVVIDPTNPNIVYVGTAQGGVWKTINGGLTWTPTSDNEVSLAIGALAIDPTNPQILYAGTGEGNFSGDSYYGNGVLKTTNGALNWTNPAQATFTGTRFSRITVTPGTTARLFAATSAGLYRSTNAGVNWTQLTGAGLPTFNATDVCIDSTTPTTVYAAFWGNGIYKSTNASAATPTWVKLAGGLPASGFTRISLGISATNPLIIYALIADAGYAVNQFFRTTDGGATWTAIPLPGGSIGGQGFYNLNVAVDPSTPDIVYLSGISVWKAIRSSAGVWTITDIGGTIHPDNHAFAIQASNHQVVYAGSDGGIYKSVNGGLAWSDQINEGLCITQFEFIDQHPTSDAVVIGGTQDNGTEQYRNSSVFYHADDGDGGACAIDFSAPKNVISTYYYASPKRSTQGGKFGSWLNVSTGLVGSALFYPPLTLNQTNSNEIAMGTDRVNLDPVQGTTGWPTKVLLPGVAGLVSALHYVNSNLIYAGTTSGQVYRLTRSGTVWTAVALQAAPLPGQYIWDIAALPANANMIIVVMSGFGISHVWQGAVASTGTSAVWTNISGTGGGILPDIPVNALVIDPNIANTYYIATDVAVYRTINAGNTWTQFSEGLPNCAVFDLRLHNPTRLLRAGTHGRGLWERKLDVPSLPNVDLFFRDHPMATGRQVPTPSPVVAAFDDPLQYVALGDQLWWWQCADIKVDALEGAGPAYQFPVAAVDYLVFDNSLQHRNAQRGNLNRVYVQVHNRGFAAGASVTVRLYFADASAGLPPLPANFWSGASLSGPNWFSIGPAKIIPSLSPVEPTILEWDWATPATAAAHTCLLVVMDSPADPIPAANKSLNVGVLVPNEKRVGLKNLSIVNPPPGAVHGAALNFFTVSGKKSTIRINPSAVEGWKIGAVLPKTHATALAPQPATGKPGATAAAIGQNWQSSALTKAAVKTLRDRFGAELEKYDTSKIHTLADPARGGALPELALPKAGISILFVFTAAKKIQDPATVDVIQEEGQQVVGGNTFVLQARKPS
ncbi:MAG TPA: hypothetical protein VGW57_01400 [Chthoniobacterales bacterium]|nr:hypothetical protein [Chthoniobacterales bacterium]